MQSLTCFIIETSQDVVTSSKRTIICAMTVRLTFIVDIVHAQNIDHFMCQPVLVLIHNDLDKCPTDWYVGQKGSLYYHECLYILDINGFRRRILVDCHRSKLSIHSDGNMMY